MGKLQSSPIVYCHLEFYEKTFRINLNNIYLCWRKLMKMKELSIIEPIVWKENPLDPENNKGFNPYISCCDFKKCCKKYKKGKRCKKCPGRP